MKQGSTRKALFILHEGIGTTIFNSQVLEHAKGMKEFGVSFDILAFNTLSKTWKLSQTNLEKSLVNYPGIKIILKKAVHIYYPFSTIFNSILLILFLLKHGREYEFIHARADYTAFLSILTKPVHGLKVYWDCRGAAVDELKDTLKRKNFFVRLIGELYLVPFEFIAAYVNCKMCDGAIFVSDSLRAMFKKTLRNFPQIIVPCPVSEEKFFFNSSLRKRMRSALNISDNDVVYLYSGSMIAYQSLSHQFKMYQEILLDNNHIIIIATSEPEKARTFFKDLQQDRLRIVHLGFEEMNSYYNLADFSFLIREKKLLNYVASPTKFGEYCLTGLPVIMNDTVEQALRISKSLGNYISPFGYKVEKFDDATRYEIASRASTYFSRKVLNQSYAELYAACPSI